MASIAEIAVSTVKARRRFDAGYYRPEFLKIEQKILLAGKWTTLGELTKPLFSKGIFDVRAEERL
jgi:hypothetical protein